ncbi:MAG: hypothetical protein WBB47_13095 [Paenisporosarcina sp.]
MNISVVSEALEKSGKSEINNDYCYDNEIYLIHIQYWYYENIEAILEEALGLVTA